MKYFNKNLLIIIIVFFTYLNTYTITTESIIAVIENSITSTSVSTSNSSSNNSISTFDTTPYNFTADTPTETVKFQTVMHEDKIMLTGNYYNKETGEIAYAEEQLYPDNSLFNQNGLQFDLPSLSSPIDTTDISNPSHTQQEHDHLNDHLDDSARDTQRQIMDENHAAQMQNAPQKYIKVIREQDLQKNTVYFRWDFGGIPLDSDLLLKNKNIFHDPRAILSSPIIKARFERINCFYAYKIGLGKNFQPERNFVDAFRSEKGVQLLDQIYNSDLPTATAAFNELKKLWIRQRKHMFLVHNSYSKRELKFITELGIDIMAIAERALVTRPDYIAEHTNEQSLKAIQEYKNHCVQLQQKGNRSALRDEIKALQPNVNKKSDFATKISLAIAKKTFFNPVTIVLDEIAHAPSLENACIHVKSLELQLLTQAQKHNIVNVNRMRTWTTEHYGFDVLAAAHDCYASRPDYVYTPENQSYLSDTIKPILHKIESKNLPAAHAELVHLETQIDKALEELNITDPIAQKEYIKKSLGRDVLAIAHKTYESRLDYKELAKAFIAIDVEKATATILENNNTYESVANEMSDLAKCVFVNADHCKLSNLPKIKSHVYGSIDAMGIAHDRPTFIFNLSMVNRTLGDIQLLTHAILTGSHPILVRSSELLIGGIDKFFRGLNPFTQASNIGHLAYNLGSLLGKGGTALWNDPITTIDNGIISVFTLTELIRKTSDFTSDLLVGKLYLSPEEYKQRTDAFCAMIKPLQGVTAEHCVYFLAQVAADVVFYKGLGSTYGFLKEIDVLGKLGESAAVVARTFKKGFDTHLADNPVVITAEGIVLKMSNGMKDFNKGPREIINSTKTLLENAYAKIAPEVKEEIATIKKIYDRTKDGFAEFSHVKVTMEYEHILGMELDLSKKGKLAIDGFHHDLKTVIEKSNILDFVNKVSYEHGFYKAALFDKGNFIKNATFFPAEWSREKVISKIYEAYGNFIKSGAIAPEKGGKYIVDGLISEGITIRMFITKAGRIVTAYPKL